MSKKYKKRGGAALMFEIITYIHKRINGGMEDRVEVEEKVKNYRKMCNKNKGESK